MRRFRFAACAVLLAGCVAQSAAPSVSGAAPAASGQEIAELGGVPLTVFTYRPPGCTPRAMLLVFHGLERNAAGYRDDAVPLAQRGCMLVVAPLFDAARFPTWRYQRGGLVHDGAVQPAASWTVALVPQLVAWVRAREQRPDLPYAMIGHSAGAQFLSRVMAFDGAGVTQAVIANPSTWVRPSLSVTAPYGFGGVPDGEAALRRYLAAPITVLLGQDDTGSRNLASSEAAEEQGANRLARGRATFAEAEQVARAQGWPFGWRLAIVPGAGHNARAMFTSDQALAALHP